MPAATLAIVNPHSRAGGARRRWAAIEAALRDSLGALEVACTRGPRDAERIAREAVRSGVERLVVAGGDGTTSEVVAGLLSADLADYAQMAVLPMGSGCDFARTLGLPREPEAAVELLGRGESRRVDAGRIDYRDRSGRERTGYFINVASFGISGLTDEFVNRAGRSLGATAAFAIGTLRAIARFRAPEVAVRVDDQLVYEGPVSLGAVANGRYFGGGMQIAPQARIDDGTLEVIVVEGLSKPRLVASFPSLYRGAHLTHPAVTCRRGTRVEAALLSGEALLDVDGEPLGGLPARVEVLPAAVQLFGLPAAADRS